MEGRLRIAGDGVYPESKDAATRCLAGRITTSSGHLPFSRSGGHRRRERSPNSCTLGCNPCILFQSVLVVFIDRSKSRQRRVDLGGSGGLRQVARIEKLTMLAIPTVAALYTS